MRKARRQNGKRQQRQARPVSRCMVNVIATCLHCFVVSIIVSGLIGVDETESTESPPAPPQRKRHLSGSVGTSRNNLQNLFSLQDLPPSSRFCVE